MRARGAAFLLLAAGLMVGCGSSDDDPPARLSIAAPADSAVVREDSVEVRGRVEPADARVTVLGEEASVDPGGEFQARVPLREGANVIDVGAAASGAVPAWRAVRIARQVVVKVPELDGDSRDDAVDQLEELGLRPDVDKDEGLLDRFLPTGFSVCATDPEAGTELAKGARVRVTVSKSC